LERNEKLLLFTNPTLAIVDPERCRTAPPNVTANTGLDALAHAAESITSTGGNPYAETLGLGAIQRIAKYLPVACKDGGNMEARSALSLAANWAGIAFADTGLHIGHAAADTISAAYATNHGLNCAWTTPPTMEYCAKAAPDKIRSIGEALGVVFPNGASAEEIGGQTADACRRLMRECKIPSMASLNFDREKILSGAAATVANGLCMNCPAEVTEEGAKRVLARAYDNY
jgi:alcohol dehydrogenase class IV